jgi:hypothetical protein
MMGFPGQVVAPGDTFCVTITPANADRGTIPARTNAEITLAIRYRHVSKFSMQTIPNIRHKPHAMFRTSVGTA